MGLISEIVGESQMKKYQDKAYAFGVSPMFLYYKHPKGHLQVDSMIIQSQTKEQFRRKARIALYFNEKSDSRDFSLAMGCFFGVYNIYGYETLSNSLKQEVASMDIDSRWTKNFLDTYDESILDYVQSKYSVSSEEYHNLVQKMFTVQPDTTLYSNFICRDIGKIVITSGVLLHDIHDYSREDIASLIASGEMISKFNDQSFGYEHTSSAKK